ncbi:MAG: hypothetical protein GY730_01420 [bacterium]|nr:hypothetical protein [bacterium]
MKFNKLFILNLLIVLLVSTSVNAESIIKNLKFSGEYVLLNEAFERSSQYGFGLDLITSDGIGFTMSAAYLQARSSTDKYPRLKMVPVTAGILYHFFPYRQISPYIAGLVSLNFTSKFLQTPIPGYGIKTGFFFRMDKFSGLFFEISKNFILDNKTNLALDPFAISAGLSLTLWGLEHDPEKKINDFRSKRRERRSSRRKRRKRIIERELDLLYE